MSDNFKPLDANRFQEAIRLFDEANAEDPNVEEIDGQSHPKELLYAKRLTQWVLRLEPNASEALRLAARCQHICRWKIPRDSHPLTRQGYLRWKEELKLYHSNLAGEILRRVGYSDEMIEQVRAINLKSQIKNNDDGQTMEDALCLVFLEHQFVSLADKAPREKMVTALKKSWSKMSPRGKKAALALEFEDRERDLLQCALG